LIYQICFWEVCELNCFFCVLKVGEPWK
jgi:hypothetical protein